MTSSNLDICSGLEDLARIRGDTVEQILTLNPDRTYTEKELNAELITWLEEIASSIDLDHVALRRALVDTRALERSRDGFQYKVARGPGLHVRFSPEVDSVDVRGEIRKAREDRGRSKRKR